MDLVDIDKVLDDLELDESKIVSKLTTKVSENKINSEYSENVSHKSGHETLNFKDERKSSICSIDNSLNAPPHHNINFSASEYNTEKLSDTKNSFPVDSDFSWNTTNVSMCKNLNSFNPSNSNERSTNKNNSSGSSRSVAVSQVFNSLDEYRRDVESLRVEINKIDEQSKNVDNKNVILNKCDNIEDKNGTLENITYQLQSQKSEQNFELINETNLETIPNVKIESNSPPLMKFSGEHLTKMIDDDDSVDGFTSTSSITTSSPSSFSSGPSPRSPPSVDCVVDDLNELAEYETDALSIQSNNIMRENIENVVQKEYSTSKNNATSIIQNETNSLSISKMVEDDENLEDSNGPNSIDLVGLSSISSSLYIENSLSSIPLELSGEHHRNSKYMTLSNLKINDESQNGISSVCENIVKNEEIFIDDEISTPTRSDLIKVCDISETPKDSICEISKKDVQLCLIEDKLEDKHLESKKEETKINQYSQKESPKLPITFGSTMDEISDTELDSMLQDIDNELQNNGSNKEKIFENDENFEIKKPENFKYSEEMNNKSDDIVNQNKKYGSNIPINVENNKTIETEIKGKSKIVPKSTGLNKEDFLTQSTQDYVINENTKVQVKTTDEDLNMQNADSFSQASTIEFADLQSQNDLRIFGSENEIVYSGAEIQNEKLNIVKISTSDGSDTYFKKDLPSDENKSEQEKNYDEKKNLELESVETNVAIETENFENIREQNLLRRPKVLNLPITNLAANVLPNNILASDTERTIDMLNLAGTAGQTPPASALTNLNPNLTSLSQDVSPFINNQQTENSQNAIETSQEIQPQIVNNELEENNLTSTSNQQIGKQNYQLGKVPPFWIPDSEASFCMQCKVKFSLIKRRHHCRACGHVLCSLCCSQKAKLEFLGNDNEVRVCVQCHLIINNMENSTDNIDNQLHDAELGAVGGIISSSHTNNSTTNNFIGVRMNSNNFVTRSPNPNNPMEYCSTIPPHEQVKRNQTSSKPISVMVPVGVLKREGALSKNRKDKNVIFSDGIRPGCDLADLDNSWLDKSGISNSSSRKSNFDKEYIPPVNPRILRKSLPICDENNSYIPKEINALPPIYEKVLKTNEYNYKEIQNNIYLIERLQKECLKFAVQRNFYVYVKIVKLTCCVNKTVINFTTSGMHHVGQDEMIILLEYDNSNLIPKDIFIHLNEIYRDADKGHPITELGYSIAKQQHFLAGESKITTNGGFLYIRATFQCLQEINLPDPPFLIGVLIHRWEIPWAKVFPLRLMLRLGAQYRYYPSPHLSIRGRSSVYAEIAQTIINFLADFRNYSYTIPIIKGMIIHMEDRKTSVLIPRNRHDQIVKALNNSSDHILALCGNFSRGADGHLVCIQNLESDCPDTHTYSTQAINIQGQPRRVTGASFIVLNGALKTNSGLSGKCSIIEDGLMVHILSQKMQLIRKNLKNMKDIEIKCGPIDVDESQTEMVSIQWVDDDTEFNIGVKSPIDNKKLDGISSIRVHSGLNYSNSNFIIRWTEVFLIQSKRESLHGKVAIDISKISEQIARSTSTALVPLLDLLAASECYKIALRVTLHQDNVCYEAGSKNFKLAPLYMNALDNELIPILHKQATMYEINSPIILELIFHILHK